MEQINERSTAYLAVTFKDKAGAEQAPAAVAYRIDDVGTGASIRASTAISPAGTIEITLTPDDNRIADAAKGYEQRRVTVSATYGANDAAHAQYIYEIVNLAGIESP